MMGTKRWKGRLVKGMIGPGVWKLEADDGRSYQLVGSIPDALEGARVVVTGESEGLMGIAVLAGVIRVSEVRRDRSLR
jgi:hypothetical protein